MKKRAFRGLLSGVLGMATWVGVSQAEACGGFFCSQTQPVNQAAERIIFAKNNNGTVTAVIEIQYQGPSQNFSWLLPISSVPNTDQIAVASNSAFQRLQQATNPNYSLTTRVEGTCDVEPNSPFFGAAGTGGAAAGPPTSGVGGAVTVSAMGIVGAFEYKVISLEASLPNPADAAVQWLTANGYDVPAGAPALLGPYLADGMHLLALRLVKGADTGSIRPLVLTYNATKPMIPIKLTAVAANENMGVMTWILGDAQAIPQNYNALELNEARINWFNASQNYNDVVTAAANDAGGQGFVTEYAQPTSALKEFVWSANEEQLWQNFKQQPFSGPDELFVQARNQYGAAEGFWDMVAKEVTVPPGQASEVLQTCYFPTPCRVSLDPAKFIAALEADVIQPARVVQQLLDAHPQVTRMYTTLSAAEMTVDPLFAFNPELAPVSNLHTAERIIECAKGFYQSEAPWRIELPKGGVIRGTPATLNTWPDFSMGPANQRILRQAETGAGRVLEDNSAAIVAETAAYSAGLAKPMPTVHPTTMNASGGSGNVAMTGNGTGATGNGSGTGPDSGTAVPIDDGSVESSGCSASSHHGTSGANSLAFLGILAGMVAVFRRGVRRQVD
ncbi:MAG: DUF2330 domain-containing protein [Polyangiaceae bacterium]|nr:DUF2330 domain-containing protein [Polyangiaceae bacterium]